MSAMAAKNWHARGLVSKDIDDAIDIILDHGRCLDIEEQIKLVNRIAAPLGLLVAR